MSPSPFFEKNRLKSGKHKSLPDFDSNTHNHLKINFVLRHSVDIFWNFRFCQIWEVLVNAFLLSKLP